MARDFPAFFALYQASACRTQALELEHRMVHRQPHFHNEVGKTNIRGDLQTVFQAG